MIHNTENLLKILMLKTKQQKNLCIMKLAKSTVK